MTTGGGILALDLASVTGFAGSDPRGRVFSGAVNLAAINGSRAETLARLEAWLDDHLVLHRPRVVAKEAAIVQGGGQGRALLLLGMSAIVEKLCWQHGVAQVEDVHASSLKKFFTGFGNAEKGDMMFAARRLGFNPASFDEADAIAVLIWAAAKHGMALCLPKGAT